MDAKRVVTFNILIHNLSKKERPLSDKIFMSHKECFSIFTDKKVNYTGSGLSWYPGAYGAVLTDNHGDNKEDDGYCVDVTEVVHAILGH